MKQTRFNANHRKLGAKMIEFVGWDMPVEYEGIIDEHIACRTAAGLFDVSHMGEIHVTGIFRRTTPPVFRPVWSSTRP